MTNAQDPTPGTTRDPRAHREDMTRLVREEAARRRTSEEASHAGERKSRIPYRLLAILVLATVTVIAATRSVSEVMVFLKHPGETPVRGMSLVEVDRLVPSVSLGVDGKTLVVNVGAGWSRWTTRSGRAASRRCAASSPTASTTALGSSRRVAASSATGPKA
ncbi:MAG: hypothetical protein IPK07_33700 [Deltaproteobacteria bacterium]|nr:hypothetical protein [Deltaproteobacteria bacterium]